MRGSAGSGRPVYWIGRRRRRACGLPWPNCRLGPCPPARPARPRRSRLPAQPAQARPPHAALAARLLPYFPSARANEFTHLANVATQTFTVPRNVIAIRPPEAAIAGWPDPDLRSRGPGNGRFAPGQGAVQAQRGRPGQGARAPGGAGLCPPGRGRQRMAVSRYGSVTQGSPLLLNAAVWRDAGAGTGKFVH